MFKNYLTILVRSLLRNKFSATLNFVGLALGMACYLLIFHYATFELSFDQFHENSDNIVRLQRNVYQENQLKLNSAATSMNVGPAMKEEYPEILAAARVSRFPDNVVTYRDKTYANERIMAADQSIFDIFSFNLAKGDRSGALAQPNRVLLSQTLARKYFGDEDPIGKFLKISNRRGQYDCMVSGVLEDIPANSSLRFDMMVSFPTLWNAAQSDWIYAQFYTYFLLAPGSSAASLETKLPAFIDKYIVKHVPLATNWKYFLQPLDQIYLYSDLMYDTDNGNGSVVYFLLLIAFLILVISWINYTNLSTSQAIERAREVGVRKVLGSHRTQLIKQFLLESFLTGLLPVVLAVLLVILLMPQMRALVGKEIPLYLAFDVRFWLHLIVLYAVGSLLSGLYPAFVLSGFRPITFLKRSKLSQTRGGRLLKKSLVGFQLTASTVLLILSAIVYLQVQYMRTSDLGIDISNVVAVKLPPIPANAEYMKNLTAFQTELLQYPAVKGVSGSSHIPGSDPRFRRLVWKTTEKATTGKVQSIIFIDHEFVPTYGLEMAAGRNFSKEFGTDRANVLVNQQALKVLGYDSQEAALNQEISIWALQGTYRIVGIVKDYHHQSLKSGQSPIVFLFNPMFKSYYSVNIAADAAADTMSIVREKWNAVFPGFPFDYTFLKEHFDNQYRADRQFGSILGMFVMLVLIVTCLGLLGLAYFNALQKNREIGIRKTMGAGVSDILLLLTSDFIKLTIAAMILAWPTAYYLASQWLADYAFRIPMPWAVFGLAGIVIGAVAILTMGYHTATAAAGNPVDALRDE
jgi:putative ABC transport system permease protein